MFSNSKGLPRPSLTNFFNDLPGSLSSSSGADPGHISQPQQDSVYLYQLQFPNPRALTEETLHVSKILDHALTSRKVYERLQKLDLIKADGEVSTAPFDKPAFAKEFPHSLSIIPISRQKEVVDFLFWWEGETMRLRKLLEEKAELKELKTQTDDIAQQDRFQLLLERVQLKINARPSRRIADMEEDKDLVDEEAVGMGIGTGIGNLDAAPPAYR